MRIHHYTIYYYYNSYTIFYYAIKVIHIVFANRYYLYACVRSIIIIINILYINYITKSISIKLLLVCYWCIRNWLWCNLVYLLVYIAYYYVYYIAMFLYQSFYRIKGIHNIIYYTIIYYTINLHHFLSTIFFSPMVFCE